MSVTGQQVASEAKKLKPGIFGLGTILYVLGGEMPEEGLDCQGLIEYVHRQCGMKMNYKGTNDMWRNALSEKGTIEEGVKRHSNIPIGALIFICDYGVVPKGYTDPPDCGHVYIKTAKGELVHASAGNGKVTTRDFADKSVPNGGPTHYGLVAGVDYGVGNILDNDAGTVENGMDNGASVKPQWKPQYSHLVFKEGGKGNGTREIQTALTMLGHDIQVDGEFGPLTAAAVRTFQENSGLAVDGIVGRDTWAAMIQAVNAQ